MRIILPGRAALAVLLFSAAVSARAQEDPLGRMFPGSSQGSGASGRIEATPGSSRAPALVDQREDGRVVVSSNATDSWTARERLGLLTLGGTEIIPRGGPAVPRHLWSGEAGVRWARRLDERGRALGAVAAVGSASDLPLHGIRQTTLQLALDYRLPSGRRNAWLFFLGYSNNRYFANGVPLPGVAYQFRTEDGVLDGLVGFPFAAIGWHPAAFWDARATAFGPRRWTVDGGRRFDDGLRAHAGFDWGGQTWLRADRPDRRDRLGFERKRLYSALDARGPWGLSGGLTAGREFDRFFYETTGEPRASDPRASLPPAWFVELMASVRFL